MVPSSLLALYTIVLTANALANEEGQGIDTFYDESSDSNWVILAGDVQDDFASKWAENDKWDIINENVETQKGHFITRKCENVFGQSLCLCRFEKLDKVHNCHKNTAKETRKQSHLRSAYPMNKNKNNAFNSVFGAHSAVQTHLNNMVTSMRSHPLFKRFIDSPKDMIVVPDTKQEQFLQLKEDKIETEIAAAKVEARNDMLTEEELEDLEDEVEELIEEEEIDEDEQELEEELYEDSDLDDTDTDMDSLLDSDMETELEQLLDSNLDDTDIDSLLDSVLDSDLGTDEEYDEEILEVLDEEVDTQKELIVKQNVLIEELKQDNAMKEELIEILEDETDTDEMDEDEQDWDEDMDEDEEDDQVGYDDDNGGYYEEEGEMENEEENDEEYYDNQEDLANEDYDELYDVNGEEEESDFEQEEVDSEMDLERKEKEAMIADTFWGLEIYSVAFMILCCCCVSCYMHKTKCCGYFAAKEKAFQYNRYHHQGGFKKVFGNVDEEEQDVEMGAGVENNSEEAQALHSN